MNNSFRSLALSAILPLTLTLAAAQTPPPATPQTPPAGQTRPTPPAQTPRPGQPRPYADVVTKEAVTQEGFFKVHQIDDKVLFEIPAKALERDILWTATIAKAGSGDGAAGMPSGESVVRFARRGNRVYIRAVDYGLRSESDDEGTRTNISDNTLETLLASLPVQAEGPDSSVVLDVTSLFLGNPADIGQPRPSPGVIPLSDRSYIEKVKSFPENVVVTSTQTFTGAGGASTSQVRYSMVALPEKPVKGRLWDSRIGFFPVGFSTLGSDKNRREDRAYITRFHLEKKDPNAAISEPVQPITWYISREVPTKWRSWVRKGLEDWNVAFEQAGFKNAIVVKDAPSVKEDPDWSPEDSRFSVVRWSPQPVENAFAGPTVDPRSGQTISSRMVVFHDVMKLAAGWYYVQSGAADPRASRLPLPDDLQGELIRYVVAHEMGHALGLFHNWKASSHYTVEQLRDPKFTDENGVSASIMDYSRFNYVAQPGDGVKQLIGKIGPYDKFAIEWGYKPIPGAATPEAEERILDTWLARQVTDPRLRYWPEQDSIDAAAQNEDIGSDAVAATRLGLKNLDRIASKNLLTGTTKLGEDYSLLAETRNRIMFQRTLELRHVTKQVGGVVGTDWHAGRGGDVYRPVPAAKQREAVMFLVKEGLVPSQALYAPALLNRIQATGQTSEIGAQQYTILNALFQEGRLQRLTDQEAQLGKDAYTVSTLFKDVTGGVFAPLSTAQPVISLPQRSLQRAYLRVLDTKVNAATPSQTDSKAFAVANLQRVAKQIDAALPKTKDESTRAHLAAVRMDIGRIMNGKFSAQAASAAPTFTFGRGVDGHQHGFGCGWGTVPHND